MLLGKLLFSWLLPQSGLAQCEKPVHIQLVQVQDATSSFANDIEVMKKVMAGLISDLSSEFGPLDFGLAEFSDKPQLVTGFGKNLGIWKEFYRNTDFCYKRVAPLSPDVNMSGIVIGGGKDDHENQWDALAMSSMDPGMNWHKGEFDEQGRILIRMVVLVTDAGAHRMSPRDFEPDQRNWYHEELFRGPCGYDEKDTCTGEFGSGTGKSHMALGLKNLIAHYKWFRIGNDSELLTNVEYSGWEHRNEFNEFRFCCTEIYNVFPQAYYKDCDAAGLGSYADCAKISCKRCPKCNCDDPEFEVDWIKGIDIPDIPITDYVYGRARFDDSVDCGTMEYPDPFSQEYADIFKLEGVTPVLFLRLPDTVPSLGNNWWPWQWMDMFKGNHTCPKAGQRLAKYWLCKADVELGKPHWQPNGITATGVCDGYDESELDRENFYYDCFMEHYGEPVEAMKANGVNAYMSIVSADVEGKDLTDRLKEYIRDVMDNHPSCHSTTTKLPVPTIPTVTSVVPTTTSIETTAKPTTAVAPTTTAKPTTAVAPTTTAKPTTAVAPTTTTAKPTTAAAPTTAKPTTAAPTTAKPTTAKPTTAAPTTAKPTTVASTTAKPTTVAPTTAKPTTVAPTTVAPTTVAPTTVAPTTDKPTTAVAPTTAKPTTAVAPTTAKPTTVVAPTTTTVAPTTAKATTVVAPTTAKPTSTKEIVTTTVEPTTVKPTPTATTAMEPTTTSVASTMKLSTSEPAPLIPTFPTEAPFTAPSPPTEQTEVDESTDSGGPSTTVIVGSAAAGVAAVGAGAALWAKGLIPGMNSTVTDTHIEEANVKQDMQEREQLTEVNANMFL